MVTTAAERLLWKQTGSHLQAFRSDKFFHRGVQVNHWLSLHVISSGIFAHKNMTSVIWAWQRSQDEEEKEEEKAEKEDKEEEKDDKAACNGRPWNRKKFVIYNHNL